MPILFLSVIDGLSAISLTLLSFQISIPAFLVFIFIVYLGIKVYIDKSFSFDNVTDCVVGALLLFAFFITLPKWSIIASAGMAVKALKNVFL